MEEEQGVGGDRSVGLNVSFYSILVRNMSQSRLFLTECLCYQCCVTV